MQALSGYESTKLGMILPRIPFFFHPNRTLQKYLESTVNIYQDIETCDQVTYTPRNMNWLLPNGQAEVFVSSIHDVGQLLCKL